MEYILTNNLINKFNNYNIFIYYNITTIESCKTGLSVNEIKLSEPLKRISYKKNDPLDINYKINISMQNKKNIILFHN